LGERATIITKKVVEIAEQLKVTPGQVAINWTRQNNGQRVIPIVGATKVEQLEDVLGCLTFELPEAATKELNEISKIELPFPQRFFTEATVMDVLYGGMKDQMKDTRY
jgi:aryl-alcohol dehydrogenase-like predicted oxidoreductase